MKIDVILLKLINKEITLKEFNELLDQVDNINAKLSLESYNYCTAVDVAVFTNQMPLLKTLLAKGADPGGAKNLTLHYAVKYRLD